MKLVGMSVRSWTAQALNTSGWVISTKKGDLIYPA